MKSEAGMTARCILGVGCGVLGLASYLIACGGSTGDFGEGGTDATMADHTAQQDSGPVEDSFQSFFDAGKDSGKHHRNDAGTADTGGGGDADAGPPEDAGDAGFGDGAPLDGGPLDGGPVDAGPDVEFQDAVADVVTAPDTGPVYCDAGDVVDCMCGVRWTCGATGDWSFEGTCTFPCVGPPMCLPLGAPLDLGVSFCAGTAFADGGFYPCCSGGSVGELCSVTCD
jgi:hypothetical protein